MESFHKCGFSNRTDLLTYAVKRVLSIAITMRNNGNGVAGTDRSNLVPDFDCEYSFGKLRHV